jgi:ATP-dependent exoDNAse (exonuclease V) beta subunit
MARAATQLTLSPSDGFAPADQAVRDRIRTDLDSNLCVEAGAGTGKTTVLVSRIVEVLRQGYASIDEIAVITFTEKAAAELAARVREELERALASPECGPEERERLRQAILGLHRARIETIHAFAANILRERPVEAGLDPNFEVLQGVAGGLAFEDAYEEWIERLFGGSGEESELLARALNRGFDLKQVRDAVDAIHEHRYAMPLVRFPGVVHADVGVFVGEVGRICRDLEDAGQRCHDETDRGYAQLGGVTAFRDELERAGDDRARIERVIFERPPNLNLQLGSRDNFASPEDCDRMKASFKELRALIEQTKDALRAEALAEFLPVAEEFVRDFTARRRTDGHADFDDLLLWARDLLRDNLEVRTYFQRRFRSVLVDEFQDTDPIQAELMVYVCSDVSDGIGAGADWRELRLRPGALFVVGDPKQSIYRFRRADMAIYDAVKKGPLAGQVVELTQNFRSLDGLIEWVNGAFDHIFVEQEGVQPRNTPLVAAPSKLELGRSPVVVLHGADVAANASDLRKAEAEALAGIINRAVGEEEWPVRDTRERDVVRPARFSDVALLVPSRTEIELYEDAFNDAGLPFRHEGNRSFFQRQEVKELAACLEAIDDPTDRLNLVTALRSSAFACSDEDLFLFVAAGGHLDYFRPVPHGHEAVAGAFEVLRELHRERRKLGLPELVHRLISRTHWAELALTIPQGEQAAANLLKVVDQARAFAGAAGGGLRAFARWLETGRDPDTEEQEASVMEETDNVVRLLTIHHAKGLEFPIVALANLNSAPPNQPSSFYDRESGLLQTYATYGFRTPGFKDAFEREKQLDAAERLRQLYVACTRARDHLIVALIEKERGGFEGMLETLLPYVPLKGDTAPGTEAKGSYVYDSEALAPSANGSVNGKAPKPSAADIQTALSDRENWIQERNRVIAEASRRLAVQTATGAPRDEEPPPDRRDWTEVAESADRPDRPARTWIRRSSTAARIGETLHRVMEKVDLPDAKNLEPLARAICTQAGVPDNVDEVIEMAHNCLASPTVQQAAASGSYSRELPFSVQGGDRSERAGRVDLLFRDHKRLVAVDYKTDRLNPEELDERMGIYEEQAHAYADGVRRTVGLAVVTVVLVFARLQMERVVNTMSPAGSGSTQ